MNLDHFLQKGQSTWQSLESLLDKEQKLTNNRLSKDELDALGRLYRMSTSDLALARREFPRHRITGYLNQLVARAHGQIYQSEPLQRNQLVAFFRTTFPQLYRDILPYTITATLLFIFPAVIAFLVVWNKPDTIYLFEGDQIGPLVRQVEEGELWVDIEPQVRSAMSAVIMTNNIQVSFLAFAGGILAGLMTAWVMIFNGIHLGAIFGLLQFHSLSGGLAEFVVGHGFIELSVIMLAGGAGLYLGDGLLRPGLLPRWQAIVERGKVSVQLILGCIPLLIIAGIIEGFISPSGLPWPVKLAVGLITGVVLHTYWLRSGRG